MTSKRKFNRRDFIQTTSAATAAGVFMGTSAVTRGQDSPNERPVFATIGLRNQGWTITDKSTKFADFAAFADVDANVLGANQSKSSKRKPARRLTATRITARFSIATTSMRS